MEWNIIIRVLPFRDPGTDSGARNNVTFDPRLRLTMSCGLLVDYSSSSSEEDAVEVKEGNCRSRSDASRLDLGRTASSEGEICTHRQLREERTKREVSASFAY